MAEPVPEETDNEDHYSFEDSDRFDDDSLCSWSSEPESLLNNWRGWKRPGVQVSPFGSASRKIHNEGSVVSLSELTARCVAAQIPFELVERVYPPVPEQLQLRIAYWSFPDNEEDIRLYSCLANGSSEEYNRGDHLYRNKSVKDPLQIGFHLSAKVEPANDPTHVSLNVAVTFDRRRVTSCNCTCTSTAYWCSHVVAVCLHRINKSETVTLRAPVSESLSRLHREQLQKFAQFLISELPQQILPTAQRLLDDLLSSQPSYINSVCGAPDPTAGASITDQTSWYLDEKTLHENIKKIVIKFCVPAPIVFSDVNYLTTSAPPAAAEWTSLLRPLRGREPEGMWNLLSIVREMYKRNDRNAVPLLSIITDECLNCEQIVVWWFNTSVALHAGGGGGRHAAANSNTHATQHACSSLCEEMVVLWKLAALNPALSPEERKLLEKKFSDWHAKIIERVTKSRGNILSGNSGAGKISGVDIFPGLTPAIKACQMDWDEYPLPGITYTSGTSPLYHCSFACFRQHENHHQVNSSEAVLNHHAYNHHHIHMHHNPRRVGNTLELLPAHRDHPTSPNRDGNRSSTSSEGFCENEAEADDPAVQAAETDSQEGGGSDSLSSSDVGVEPQSPVSLRRPQLSIECSRKMREFASKEQSSEESDAGVFAPEVEGARAVAVDKTDLVWKTTRKQSAISNSDDEGIKCVDGVESSPEKEEKEDDQSEQQDKCVDDPWEVLFARAEGLHAHGHGREACILAVRLAHELLANPPNLMLDIPPMPKGKRRKVNPISHQMSCLAWATLAKCAFLCAVLTEVQEHHSLAFRVGLFGLEMARPPASTKPLEVKLANQESELAVLLKKIPLGPVELGIVRQKAQQLREGSLRSRGEALLPLILAGFIFDALEGNAGLREAKIGTDEPLAFEAAVAALGLKANVSEADHPLLCEGTRRQRGELAITLLVHYKENPNKLTRIMGQLLDREVWNLAKPQSRAQAAPAQVDPMEMNAPPQSTLNAPPSEAAGSADIQPHGSRPHSTTSAELEQGMAGVNVGTSGAVSNSVGQPVCSGSRGKEMTRYKGKRLYPSIPNQPSEAGAHFMFELAKIVLVKAGGNSSTSLFTQASTSQQHHGPHRALHISAFQIGLYALGLHNCVSPNWLSRTYSSHVSWITGQAMEIGALAISFLIETWEGHLTPPEAASIADRASRGCDRNMVCAAAELALSCLPHSHALNPSEVIRAIVQCKEQSEAMWEQSLLTVENAAKGGGVYPEVLFQVAKFWYDLHMRHSNNAEVLDPDMAYDPFPLQLVDSHGGLLLVEQQPAPPAPISEVQQGAVGGVVMASPPLMPLSYVAPYSCSFTLHPTFHPVYLTPPPYQLAPPQQYYLQPSPYPVSAMQSMGQNANQIQLVQPSQMGVMPPPPGQMPMPNMGNMPPSIQAMSMPGPVQGMPMPNMANLPPNMPNMSNMMPGAIVPVSVAGHNPCGRHQQQPVQQVHRGGQAQYSPHRCLLNSYRVGMLALETLARRVHDDRPQAKYARNPPYGDDVKWLLRIAKKLGNSYINQFCYIVVNSIVSPFILFEVALEAAHFLARNNSQLAVLSHLRSGLHPLVIKSQQMYIQCLHQKLYHLNTGDYEDFVSVVIAAKSAFHVTLDGAQQFKEWLSSIRRSKSCKKDLWTQINAALQSNSK